MKSLLIAGAASFLAAPALAGPYVNGEVNSSFTGSDYNSSTSELHVGYAGELGSDAAWYIQSGPAFVAVDGEETTTELSGKAGVGVDIAENLNIYGEISFITVDGSDDNNYGTKVGVTYSF
jgi:hypothetical protein